MKELIRFLYMKAYTKELLEVKKYVKRNVEDGPTASRIIGALDTLTTLDLLVRK